MCFFHIHKNVTSEMRCGFVLFQKSAILRMYLMLGSLVFEIKKTYSKVYVGCELDRSDVKNHVKLRLREEGGFLDGEGVEK